MYPVTTTMLSISASIQFDNNFLISGVPRMGINNLGVPLETDDSLEPNPAAIITNFNPLFFLTYLALSE